MGLILNLIEKEIKRLQAEQKLHEKRLKDAMKASAEREKIIKQEQKQRIDHLKKIIKEEEELARQAEKEADRERKEEQKRQQALAQIDQLQTIRQHVIDLAAETEEELQHTQSAKKIQALKARQISLETKLFNLDTKIAQLWDTANSH